MGRMSPTALLTSTVSGKHTDRYLTIQVAQRQAGHSISGSKIATRSSAPLTYHSIFDVPMGSKRGGSAARNGQNPVRKGIASDTRDVEGWRSALRMAPFQQNISKHGSTNRYGSLVSHMTLSLRPAKRTTNSKKP